MDRALSTPIIYGNNVKKYFGYAYNNQEQRFYFKEVFATSNTIERQAYIDFSLWYAENGSWNSAPYDIYIDKKIIISTKRNIDKQSDTEEHRDGRGAEAHAVAHRDQNHR